MFIKILLTAAILSLFATASYAGEIDTLKRQLGTNHMVSFYEGTTSTFRNCDIDLGLLYTKNNYAAFKTGIIADTTCNTSGIVDPADIIILSADLMVE